MKRALALSALPFLLAAASGCNVPVPEADDEQPENVATSAAAATAPTALFVVGKTPLAPGDAAWKTLLERAGLTVVVKTQSAKASDATGKKLVAISSTVASNIVKATFRDVTVPVLTWEASILDDMALTSASGLGVTGGQDALVIASGTDVMKHGLQGQRIVTVSPTTFSWGKPASAAFKVALLASDPSRAAIFGYEKGKKMDHNVVAKERRVGFFLGDDAASLLNSEGRLLADAAIRWAAHLSSKHSVGTSCDTTAAPPAGCASGFCSPDSVCCNTLCDSPCLTCDLPGSEGTCVPVPAGGGPRGGCFMDDQATCGNDGSCDGNGGCSKWPAGTVCAEGSCDNGLAIPPSTCGGLGFCVPGGFPHGCGLYACGTTACLTSCTGLFDCAPGAVCQGGQCVKGAGAACGSDSECGTGHCTEGVCCDSACTGGACVSCTLPGLVGTCSPKPVGTLCGAPARCSGTTIIHPERCQPSGACQAGSRGCGQNLCDAANDRCHDPCLNDTDCVAGAHCNPTTGQCS